MNTELMRYHILISILALSALLSCRQAPSPAPAEEGSLVVADRLSNRQVNQIVEDRFGHVWMATSRGLNKFDGHQFHQYFSTDDTQGLPDNQVNALLSASDGTLWAATVAGVATLTDQGSFHRVPFQGNAFNPNQLLESREGKILCSNGLTLFAYDPEQDAFRPVVRDFNAFGTGITLGSDGLLWCIGNGGWMLNAYETDQFGLAASIPLPQQTYHLADARNGELWLSGMGRLSILDLKTREFKPLPEAVAREKRLMQRDVDILYAPDANTMLLNVIGEGFFYYSRAREKVFFEDDALFPYEVPDAEVRTLFRDSRNNLWFGTTDQGYAVSYEYKSFLNSNPYLTGAFEDKTVVSVCPDRDGHLWIATLRDGLYCYNLNTNHLQEVSIDRLIPDSSVGYIRISRVFCDSAGELWLLFTDKMRVIGCSWDGRQLTQRHFFYALNPMSIAEDDQGYIWVGGFNQYLLRYDKASQETETVALSGQEDFTYVPELLMREPGRLIAACFNHPPVEVNTYTLESAPVAVSEEAFRATIRRSVLIPNTLFKDSAGDIWIGTIANGLVRHESGGSIHRVDGAPCLDICSIEEDRQGNIWVSTMSGLGKYDRTVDRFVHYFESDGIGGDQFSPRASCVLPDGTLVFGGAHGLTWFNPLDVPAKRTVPLVFQDLSIHNRLVRPSADGPIAKELCEKPDITIRPEQNAFRISFSALEYGDSEQIRYAYQLQGFDKDWVKIDTRNDAYFANLPPGDYTLRVRIANASHSISDTEESLHIHVLAPWYASWWARLLFVLLGLAVLFVIWRLFRHIRRVRKEAARRIWQVRKQREEAERAQAAEKQLNQIQMNYFSNVAHEFRTPLTMIAGPAQQLAASEHIEGQDKELVDIIRRNSTWMLSLVNQLLDFNRIGNSKPQLKVARMDIVEPLKDSVNLFRFNARQKGLELGSYGLETPQLMWADADKVQKVVMNLLSNAIKFTPAGGKVTLRFDVLSRDDAAARFPLGPADKDTEWASISVADSGPGIPEDQLEKIFERFYQSEEGKKVTGSGIGLFYARALCTLHHGYIKAWNREEGGALFSLVLPVNESSYTEDERSSVAPVLPTHALAQELGEDLPEEDEGKKLVAVVDDDVDIANYLRVLLKPQYKVVLYYDGESALKGMAEEAPDLVISDVMMPGMDGYELCSRIKGDLQLSHIPVVLVTAKVAVESQVQGLDKGADAYVTKPFQPPYLLALVKSLLENREKLRRQLGQVTTTEDIAPEALSPRDAAFMSELYELMEKELANADLDIIRISEMMKISRSKFYYKVKGLTGENPAVFFKRYKLNRAADLLKEGKYNMSEIAWMTGFNTHAHFSTSFKKQFGVPPSEYAG